MFSLAESICRNPRRMRLLRDEAGATMVEYALIVGLIAVTCLFSMSVLGSNIKSVVGDAGTALSTSGN